MTPNDMIGHAISGTIFLLMLALGIFFIVGNGKGAGLIAGFNTMSKKKQEQYDKKSLCRFAGWLLIAVDACMALIAAGEYFGRRWLSACGGAATVVLILGSVVYANTGGRFKKQD